MIKALIQILRNNENTNLCGEVFDESCGGVKCDNCPFNSDANMAKLMRELEAAD